MKNLGSKATSMTWDADVFISNGSRELLALQTFGPPAEMRTDGGLFFFTKALADVLFSFGVAHTVRVVGKSLPERRLRAARRARR
jgi:hypothetical protein